MKFTPSRLQDDEAALPARDHDRGGCIAPKGLPLLATIMLGNLMKESGVVARLTGRRKTRSPTW